MSSFYIVWRYGGDYPAVMHSTLEAANKEADRLCTKHPEVVFYVLKTLNCRSGQVTIKGVTFNDS